MKVLIIEDHETLAQALKSALRIKGYDVDIACTGTDGLIKAMSTDYDVVLLDLMIPEPDGYVVCEKIHRLRPHLPVIVSTARDTPADQERAFDCGADQYLIKPVGLDQLDNAIKQAMSQKQTVDASS